MRGERGGEGLRVQGIPCPIEINAHSVNVRLNKQLD